MLLADFKRILTAFADREADVDVSRGDLLVQVRDEVISARLTQRAGELFVEEDGQELTAVGWIVNRIAKVSLLADRIIAHIAEVPDFVTPSGQLLDQPNFSNSPLDIPEPDAGAATLRVLARRPAGMTSVLYLTSDAGEGKTTLISHLARQQAKNYKAKKADWLLVPIPLGGRTFLRFDDVAIAALVNRLRFQLLYYDAFLELVRLGVLVPAFDGFEEMIVGSSSGEAVSALGNLVKSLDSSGSVLIAARRAYFDYHSLKAQARLFDTAGISSMAFARVSLDKWNRSHFLSYATKRGLSNPEAVYAAVADRLRSDHPLLTRAVLVRRLVDVATEAGGLDALLAKIGHAPQDYFLQFVSALVEREAHEKWIDLSGEPHQPLLTVDEHHELLSLVAQEMWLSGTDALRPEVVDAIAEVFAESVGKPPAVARQIRDRLRQHSLLISTGVPSPLLSFDHEDFRAFYLGEAVGRALCQKATDLKALLQAGVLPQGAVDEGAQCAIRLSKDVSNQLADLQVIATAETSASVARENCGSLAICLAPHAPGAVLSSMTFPEDALRGKSLERLTIRDSYFHSTSLAGTQTKRCVFENCRIERFDLLPDTKLDVVMRNCEVVTVLRIDRDEQIFDPAQISAVLVRAGVQFDTVGQSNIEFGESEPDEALWLVERMLRIFIRANQVNEEALKTKLGVKAAVFFDDVLPQLEDSRIVVEIPYLGHGSQRRFRLGVKMQHLHDALSHSGGSFERFLSAAAAARQDGPGR